MESKVNDISGSQKISTEENQDSNTSEETSASYIYISTFQEQLRSSVSDNSMKLSSNCSKLLKNLYTQLDTLDIKDDITALESQHTLADREKISKSLNSEIKKIDKELKKETSKRDKELKKEKPNSENNAFNKRIDKLNKNLNLLARINATFTSITESIDQDIYKEEIDKEKLNNEYILNTLEKIVDSSIDQNKKLEFILKENKNDSTLLQELLKSNDSNSVTKFFEIIKKCNFSDEQFYKIIVFEDIFESSKDFNREDYDQNIEDIYVNEIVNFPISAEVKKDILVTYIFDHTDKDDISNIVDLFIHGGKDLQHIHDFNDYIMHILNYDFPNDLENKILTLFLKSTAYPNKNILNQLMELEDYEGVELFFETLNETNLEGAALYDIFNVKDKNDPCLYLAIKNKEYDVVYRFIDGLKNSKLNDETKYNMLDTASSKGKKGYAVAIKEWAIDKLNKLLVLIVGQVRFANLTSAKKQDYITKILSESNIDSTLGFLMPETDTVANSQAKNVDKNSVLFEALSENSQTSLKNFFTILTDNDCFGLPASYVFKLLLAKNQKGETGIHAALKNNHIHTARMFIKLLDENKEELDLSDDDVINLIIGQDNSVNASSKNTLASLKKKIDPDIYNEYIIAISKMKSLTSKQKQKISKKIVI